MSTFGEEIKAELARQDKVASLRSERISKLIARGIPKTTSKVAVNPRRRLVKHNPDVASSMNFFQ